MRIAHHLAKSDLLYFEIKVHMYQVFDHALFPCCVCETTIHDWTGPDPLSLIMLKAYRGPCYWEAKRERDVTHRHYEDLGTLLIRSRRRVVCCLISNVIVLCLECRNGRDPTC